MVTDEEKELIVQSYQKTFDKEMSYDKVGLNQAQIDYLDEDREFQQRLNYHLIEQRELTIEKFQGFMLSDDDNLAYKATKDFAQLIYPDFTDGIRKKEAQKETSLKDTDLYKMTDSELLELANKYKPVKEHDKVKD